MKTNSFLFNALAIVVLAVMSIVRVDAAPATGAAKNAPSRVHYSGYIGVQGDFNNDGRVGISDITSLIDCLLGNNCDDEDTRLRVDLDGDNALGSGDVTMMVEQVIDDKPEVLIFMVDYFVFKMVRVHGGTFEMGGFDDQAYGDELPVHEVTLDDYYICQTEVTNGLWEAVVGDDPEQGHGITYNPVTELTWGACQYYVNELNRLFQHNTFRLPTEAEWEYAARGGNMSRQYKYSGSDNYDDVAWCELNSGDLLHRVGSKQPNELGLYDMSGNAWEWCQDWYGPYDSESCINPTGPETGTERVVRGGCMRGHVRFCRVTYRMCYEPKTYLLDVGFRIAMTAD